MAEMNNPNDIEKNKSFGHEKPYKKDSKIWFGLFIFLIINVLFNWWIIDHTEKKITSQFENQTKIIEIIAGNQLDKFMLLNTELEGKLGALNEEMEHSLISFKDSGSLKETVKNIEALQTQIIDSLFDESNKTKTQELITFAKSAEENDQSKAMLFYLNALSIANQKTEPLNEIISWQKKLLTEDIKIYDFISAQSRIALVADLLDRHLILGTTEDLESYSSFKLEIEGMNALIKNAQEKLMREQLSLFDEIQSNIEFFDFNKKTDYLVMLEELEKITPLEDIEFEYYNVLEQVEYFVASTKALDPLPGQPLVQPPLMENNVQAYWLKIASGRLKDRQIPIETRIEDLLLIEEHINTYDEDLRESLSMYIKEVEKESLTLQLENWVNITESLLEKNDIQNAEFLNSASSLIAQGQAYYQVDSEIIGPALSRLGHKFYQIQIEKVIANGNAIKALNFDDEIILQAAASSQSQILQIAIEMMSFQMKYDCDVFFSDLNRKSKDVIKTFTDLAEGYRIALIDEQQQTENSIKQAFVEWAEDTMRNGEYLYDYAVKLGKEWTKTMGSQEPQDYLKRALKKIYQIDSNALCSIDKGKCEYYSQLKQKFESDFKGDYLTMYANTDKISIEDFRE